MILVMKLRVRKNSVRLRLDQSDIRQFADAGSVSEAIEFGPRPDQRLTYYLSSTDDIDSVNASIESNKITISVPQSIAMQWVDGDDVGIDADIPVGPDKTLRVLIEKDFACLKPRKGEDESKAFPNPSIAENC